MEAVLAAYEMWHDKNNHLYWKAFALAAAGAAIRQPALFDWAVAQYRFALTQISPDGTLPLEMARGGKALHYHCFALKPLVMIAEFGMANALNLYAEGNGAIHRLARTTLAGISDPSPFKRATGVDQSLVGGACDLGWLDAYSAFS
jgi:poly(beta-D-mannuronate) lyase